MSTSPIDVTQTTTPGPRPAGALAASPHAADTRVAGPHLASNPAASASTTGLQAQPSALRRAAPWAVAAALLALVFAKTNPASVVASLRSVDPWRYVAFIASFSAINLLCDAVATCQAYRLVSPRLPLRWVLVVRGASYLPSVINYHLGQAYLTYLLSRRCRVPLLRVAGATLLVYTTHLGNLIVAAAIALPAGDAPPWAARTVLLALAGLLAYLVALALRPAPLRRYAASGVLFETRLRDHARLLLWRLPHVLVLSLGMWGSYALFGVRVPAPAAFVVVPLVLLFSALPFTPQGIGTRELVAMNLLAPFAPDAADRAAPVVAAGAAWVVTTAAASVVIGLAFARPAARLLSGAPGREGAGNVLPTETNQP